jgi:hypothetical protein
MVRAAGNEPFWNLTASSKGATFREFGTPDSVQFTGLARTLDGGTWTVRPVDSDSSRVALRLSFGPCYDSMSGAPFEMFAHLSLDGRDLEGCAEPAVFGAELSAIGGATRIVVPGTGTCDRLRLGPRTISGMPSGVLRRLPYVCRLDEREVVGLAGPERIPPEWSTSGDALYRVPSDLLLVVARRGEGVFVVDRVDTLSVASVLTADGAECLRTGNGATIAFANRRVNFTCDGGDGETVVGLLGDLIWGEQWSAVRATTRRSANTWGLVDHSAVELIEARTGPRR